MAGKVPWGCQCSNMIFSIFSTKCEARLLSKRKWIWKSEERWESENHDFGGWKKKTQTKYLNLNAGFLDSPMDFVSSQEETLGQATWEELKPAARFCLTPSLSPAHWATAFPRHGCSLFMRCPFPWLGRRQTELKERNVTVSFYPSVWQWRALRFAGMGTQCPPLASSVSGMCISSPRWGSGHREWLRCLRSRSCDIVLDTSLPFFALGLACWWPVRLPASSHVVRTHLCWFNERTPFLPLALGADKGSVGQAERAEAPLGEHSGIMLGRPRVWNLSCLKLDLVDS